MYVVCEFVNFLLHKDATSVSVAEERSVQLSEKNDDETGEIELIIMPPPKHRARAPLLPPPTTQVRRSLRIESYLSVLPGNGG